MEENEKKKKLDSFYALKLDSRRVLVTKVLQLGRPSKKKMRIGMLWSLPRASLLLI